MSEATCIQIKILRTTILYVLKLGLSHSGKSVSWRCSRTQSWKKIWT